VKYRIKSQQSSDISETVIVYFIIFLIVCRQKLRNELNCSDIQQMPQAGLKNRKARAERFEHQESPKGTEAMGNDKTTARVFRFTAYLSLQHQLFGEQHGLFAEGFGHLHPPRRITRTAWTFDT